MERVRFGKEEEDAVLEVIRSGKLSGFYKNFAGGKYVQEFEKEFAAKVGRKHAISVSNGTAALHTALLATMKYGNNVAVPCASFIATATSVLMAGKLPVFHDVDTRTFNLMPRKYSSATIMPVDLLGVACDVKELRENNPFAVIVEDACQALGSSDMQGKHVGEYADAVCFSFQETKTITTAGEGGMVCTDNEETAERARNIRNHGNQYSDADYLTYNYRMTEIQAAFGLVQLKKLDGYIWQQRENADYIYDNLPEGLSYPAMAMHRSGEVGDMNCYILGCLYDDRASDVGRDLFVERLTNLGVNRGFPGETVSPGYQKLIYERPMFAAYLHHPTPNANELKKKWLWLDIHRWRPLEEMKGDFQTLKKAWVPSAVPVGL